MIRSTDCQNTPGHSEKSMFLITITIHPGLVITVAIQQEQSMNPGDHSRKDLQAATNVFINKLTDDLKTPFGGQKVNKQLICGTNCRAATLNQRNGGISL